MYDPGDVLEGVAADGQTMVAVGKADGIIIRYDATGWHEDVAMPGAPPDFRFHGVRARLTSAGTEFLAVGDHGAAVVWRGGAWHAVPTNTNEKLLQVLDNHVRGDENLLQIMPGGPGADGLPQAVQSLRPLAGVQMPPLVLDSAACDPNIWGVQSAIPLDLDTAGFSADRCDASGCVAVPIIPTQPLSLVGLTSTPAFGTWAIATSGLVLDREPAGWRRMPSNVRGVGWFPVSTGITASDSSGVWAFGGEAASLVGGDWQISVEAPGHWQQFVATVLDSAPGPVLFGNECYDTNCAAFADVIGAPVASIQTTLPREHPLNVPFDTTVAVAIACPGGILAAGDWGAGQSTNPTRALIFWDGSSWSQAALIPSSVPACPSSWPISLWAPSCSDVWLVAEGADCVGGGNSVLEWTDGSWTLRTPPHGTPTAIWGRSSQDVLVVGKDGAIWHWDGGGWTSMDSGTTVDLLAVTGDKDNVWAVGDCGTILHL